MSLDNSYKKSLQAVEGVIAKITAQMTSLNTQVTTLANNLNKVGNAKTMNDDARKMIQLQEAEIKRLIGANNQLIKQTEKLTSKKKILNSLTGQEVANQNLLKRNNNLQTQSVSKLAGAYGRLIAQQKKLRKELRNSIVATGEASEKSIRLKNAYDKVTASINKVNRASGNFSKGGLRGIASGFKNLLGAFGIVGGMSLISDLTRNIFKLSKQFDSFAFAMKKIIPTAIELSDTTDFLDRITQAYGVNLITTTERYIKFDAAARQSNLRMAETQNIFETVTKASGVLGLKTHELEGVYLALEQMLSKGKVTTEELRRQLGERLPGAFGIMANALGVSTIKLDKMLKSGEVLSKEALPKFATELEKAFGLESVHKIDTLQAAQSRLSNSWTMFVRDIAGSGTLIQGVFKGVLNFLSKTLENIGELGDEIKEAFATDVEKGMIKDMSQVVELQKATEASLNSITNAQDRLNAAIGKTFDIEDRLTQSIVDNEKAILGVDAAGEDWARNQAKNIISQISSYEDYKKLIDDLGLRQDIFTKKEIAVAFAREKAAQKVIKEAENQIKSEKEIADSLKEGTKAKKAQQEVIEGSIGWYEKLIAELKKEQKYLVTTSDGYKEKQKAIDAYQKKIDDLIDAEKKIEQITKNSEKAFEKQIKTFQKLKENTEAGSSAWKFYDTMIKTLQNTLKGLTGELGDTGDEVEKLKGELEGFFNEFKSDFLGDMGFEFLDEMFFQLEDGVSKFSKLFDEAKKSGQEFEFMFQTITEVGQEAFNFLQSSQDAYFDRQYERLEQQRDVAILFAGESTTAQEEIERQYEERRNLIARRQARAQKEIAIFNAVTDTAQAVVAALPNIPLSILVGALGAAQIAMISSTKVPEFFRGTENAPEGWAKVDEKVPEIHTDRKGNIKSFGEDKANFRFLNAGDKIYSSREKYFEKELNGVLSGNDILPYSQMFNLSTPNVTVEQGLKKEDFVRHIQSLEDTIKNKVSTTVNIDKNGVAVYETKKGATRERMNNIIRLKSRNV